jgi:hypothetical protein
MSKMNTERRFRVEQDRSYSGELINENTKWANTNVTLVSTYTVYESVGIPSYETPVFTATENECKQWVESVYKQPVRWSAGGYPMFV